MEPEAGPIAPEGLRERKKRRTRSAIQKVALELFTEKGYDATTTQEIADAADVHQRTLFRHFGSKEDIVFHGTDWFLVRLLQEVRDRRVTDLPGLASALVAFARQLDGQRQVVLDGALLIAREPPLESRSLSTQMRWADQVALQMAGNAGHDEPDLAHQVVAAAVLTAFFRGITLWATSGAEGTLTDVVGQTMDALGQPQD